MLLRLGPARSILEERRWLNPFIQVLEDPDGVSPPLEGIPEREWERYMAILGSLQIQEEPEGAIQGLVTWAREMPSPEAFWYTRKVFLNTMGQRFYRNRATGVTNAPIERAISRISYRLLPDRTNLSLEGLFV